MARTIETNFTQEDGKIEGTLRPQTLKDYIGQEKIKENLKVYQTNTATLINLTYLMIWKILSLKQAAI